VTGIDSILVGGPRARQITLASQQVPETHRRRRSLAGVTGIYGPGRQDRERAQRRLGLPRLPGQQP
jgi:hypothetical protein